MSKYPTLTEMDISRFGEIRDYSTYSEKNADVLKVYYKRKKGSILPRRKVFKFQKHNPAFSENIDQSRTVHEIRESSPVILKAVAELNSLLKDKRETIDHKEQLLRRLHQLESEVNSNIAEIKSILKRL